MDFTHVVSVTAYIVDFKDFDAYNKVYREFFPKNPPPRATVGGAALKPGRAPRAADDRGQAEVSYRLAKLAGLSGVGRSTRSITM